MIKPNITSEIGELKSVILHQPGPEIENVTPDHVERALYSDILNLNVALDEYHLFKTVLQKVTKTYFLKDLLKEILQIDSARNKLLNQICANENVFEYLEFLNDYSAENLARILIEGHSLVKNSLTSFLSNERYALQPLHNFFFMRDTSTVIYDNVLISYMANRVREREALIIDSIFQYHPEFGSKPINPVQNLQNNVTIEGGDILVASEDILIIGTGARTSTQGVDYILKNLAKKEGVSHVIVQQLPHKPESFIHLDMVFTLLNNNECMVYKPVILNRHDFETVYIKIDNGKVAKIMEVPDILYMMKKLKRELKPIYCGGIKDEWIQEREQWHSGANFFAFEPGKIIGYGRNKHTIDELNKHGYEPINALEIVHNKSNIKKYKKVVVTVPGSELSRGGGGCRCMTLPLNRSRVKWD